jgi:hypothetical protein
VDGNLRRDANLIRVDIQLSDAWTGAQVWSKTFEATVGVANLLATQDEISGQASAMIGSYWGAIGTAEYKRIQTKSSTELTPYECIVQGVIGTPTDATVADPVTKARDCLERLTRKCRAAVAQPSPHGVHVAAPLTGPKKPGRTWRFY